MGTLSVLVGLPGNVNIIVNIRFQSWGKRQVFHTDTQSREAKAKSLGTSSEITLLFSKVSRKSMNTGHALRETIHHFSRTIKAVFTSERIFLKGDIKPVKSWYNLLQKWSQAPTGHLTSWKPWAQIRKFINFLTYKISNSIVPGSHRP